MQENENRSPQIFNDEIQRILEDYACEILRELAEYRRKAEFCGCHQCKMHLQSLEDECEAEAYRLTRIPALDHEEKWIMHQAINKLERTAKEKRDQRIKGGKR